MDFSGIMQYISYLLVAIGVMAFVVSTITQVVKGPGRIRVSFKTVQGSVSWDTCYTPCGMCPAFNYTSITYPC